MHPFMAFILFILLSLCGLTLFIFGTLAVVKLSIRAYEAAAFIKLKNLIKENPKAGRKDKDGNFVFERGEFTIQYRVLDLINELGQREVEPIFIERKLSKLEKKLKKYQQAARKFWLYRKWANIFDRRVIFPLLSLSIIFYLVMFEPDDAKLNRIRWFVSRAARVNKESVSVNPNGWVTIAAQRQTAVDRQIEPISYNVNLFDWFSYKNDGYVMRDKGAEYGSVSYPVVYDENGNINLEVNDQWVGGLVNLRRATYGQNQGTGIRSNKILGYDILRVDDNRILVKDK